MNTEFVQALNALEKDRGIPKDVLIDTIEMALLAAYKKNYGKNENVRVVIDQDTGDLMVLMRRDIVAEVEDIMTQMSLDEAHEIDARYEIGDAIEYQVMPKDFGRIAAQTAKQVVVQQIRETERGMVYDRYSDRQGQLINGYVHRRSGKTLFITLDGAEGILPASEQVYGEIYKVHQRLKVYLIEVRKSMKGPQILLSRTHPDLVRKLFELEVPEIADGTVEIKGIAREAGSRTKIAVYTAYENIDPIGACVGNRGLRVQMIADEINGEKIDIIEWSENPEELISNVLSPAKVDQVIIDSYEEMMATAVVPDYQLSLAIGKEGQNVRLAARVSGWKIDIKSASQYQEMINNEEDYHDNLHEDIDYIAEDEPLCKEDEIEPEEINDLSEAIEDDKAEDED